jgi:beta-alanine degradation protein BauB
MATEAADQVGTRVMFENDRVRVWDLTLEPGRRWRSTSARLPYFFIVESGRKLAI